MKLYAATTPLQPRYNIHIHIRIGWSSSLICLWLSNSVTSFYIQLDCIYSMHICVSTTTGHNLIEDSTLYQISDGVGIISIWMQTHLSVDQSLFKSNFIYLLLQWCSCFFFFSWDDKTAQLIYNSNQHFINWVETIPTYTLLNVRAVPVR